VGCNKESIKKKKRETAHGDRNTDDKDYPFHENNKPGNETSCKMVEETIGSGTSLLDGLRCVKKGEIQGNKPIVLRNGSKFEHGDD